MKEAKLYYTAPSDEAFNDMKKACTTIWNGMGNEGGYRDEKLKRIKDVGNVQDNFMYLFAMFDMNNQRRVVSLLQASTIDDLRVRMLDGGNGRELTESILGI